MLKERIQEIFDFTRSESPYKKANRGWINQYIFLDLSPSIDTLKQKDEAAKVTLFWSPINNLLSNIFIIILICSALVFTSISFAKGRLNFNLFHANIGSSIVKVERNDILKSSDENALDHIKMEAEENIDASNLDQLNQKDSLDDNKLNLNKKISNNKIDKQEPVIKDIKSSKDIEIIKNNKSKSNFI